MRSIVKILCRNATFPSTVPFAMSVYGHNARECRLWQTNIMFCKKNGNIARYRVLVANYYHISTWIMAPEARKGPAGRENIAAVFHAPPRSTAIAWGKSL